ncbi:hypothetical protein BD309DRAFT_674470 [Dichomitus squalens]|uniref:Uncharacterized protein n=1 Tax=Dichomitus squalens TaxID=114155 RepID=A0A4Q9N531_9APHY|nr:hypothetical protein BD311DRAFT_399413 [Dichomitus squalens]TBU45922.1 hypothetical protein BD309DRAFT_674470 [Dichomitus squalens]TBU56815.1 hypothetical protein BD310DRAFT_593494 [Dichomitus squalens]
MSFCSPFSTAHASYPCGQGRSSHCRRASVCPSVCSDCWTSSPRSSHWSLHFIVLLTVSVRPRFSLPNSVTIAIAYPYAIYYLTSGPARVACRSLLYIVQRSPHCTKPPRHVLLHARI